MRLFFLAIVLGVFTGSVVANSVEVVEIVVEPELTRLTLVTENVVMPRANLSEGKIQLLLPGVSETDKITLPDAAGLAENLDWGKMGGTPVLIVVPDKNAGYFKAYAKTNPNRVILDLIVKKQVSTGAVIPKDIIYDPDFDVARMGKTLLLDDDDGIDNGNLAAGVDVDWWYRRPLDYLRKEAETYIVRTSGNLPPVSTLAQYDTVIYYSGCDQVPLLLSDGDVAVLRQYVREGGHLLMFCQNIFDVPPGVAFAREVAGVAKYKLDTCVKQVYGAPTEDFLRRIELSLEGKYRPIGNWSDGFELDPVRNDARRLIVDGENKWCYAAVANYGKGRIVLATFPQENLPDNLVRMRLLKGLLLALWEDKSTVR